ncbi:alpha/beta hydrolase [Lutimaribacter sp. EGI FJ00015]|uniref:Alpha/beta hydrolase n=1 Tax=Lutimaribacter degradans TaxID=2945989 RepID=A0ACC5ZUZ8_9RHOB|nr:alpha/beta hydrolase [Lutimaribacter sp. EGI FJ00013]MCM2562162.1 alpha/beta hydrolase [Lutimaribacter sp. EGI FJ00013]MCO0613316.1 alpha/beta hydrolase [Lutimaribacter sp. EGI FJ00015]MCO0636291.1 alpha/beta hydrolase [Lutimaribacter sp. EGI FJ00014]
MLTILWLVLGLVALTVAGLVWFTWNTKRKVEAAVPPRGQFIEISTGRLHYVDKGQGPAIVMVHGLGAQLGNFDYALVDALAETHRCIAIDRPGMGWSERPEGAAANPRAQAGYVAEVIDKLGLDRPLIVGHSLGGAIGVCLALDHPEKIRGLALLAPLTRGGDAPSPAFASLGIRSPLMRKIAAWTLATPMGMRSTDLVFDLVFGPDRVPADYGTKGGGLLGLRPGSFVATSRDYVASMTDIKWMRAGYAEMPVPMAVLFGEDDRILSAETQGRKLVAEHPAITLELIAGGHMLPLTRPEACTDFIRRNDPGV